MRFLSFWTYLLISVAPLDGFVMNRVLGDYFENLLYKIFVAIDEQTTVKEVSWLTSWKVQLWVQFCHKWAHNLQSGGTIGLLYFTFVFNFPHLYLLLKWVWVRVVQNKILWKIRNWNFARLCYGLQKTGTIFVKALEVSTLLLNQENSVWQKSTRLENRPREIVFIFSLERKWFVLTLGKIVFSAKRHTPRKFMILDKG